MVVFLSAESFVRARFRVAKVDLEVPRTDEQTQRMDIQAVYPVPFCSTHSLTLTLIRSFDWWWRTSQLTTPPSPCSDSSKSK